MEQTSIRPQTRAEGSGDAVHLTSGSLARILQSLPPVKLLRSDAKTPHQASGGTDKSLKVAAEQKQEKQEKQEKEEENIAAKVSCERQNEQSTNRSLVTTPEIKILHENLEGKDEGKGRFNMFLDVAASLVYSGDLVRLSEYI